jgi:RNA polymerase sigma-54 factor
MKLADIAEEVHLDISTISRVTNSKYIETVFGTFLLKDFFSEAYRKDSGELISTKEIKNKLKEIVQQENKSNPYTDEVLCQLLGQEEYHIARRTVAKYRDGLRISSSKIRRSI